MGKKDNNYYSPTKYQKYRNASKAMNSTDASENEEYSVHNDEYFYRQIQAENNRHKERQNVNKEAPKPPVNVKKPEEKSKHYSVYDEIAERHRKEKEKNGVSPDKITPLKLITSANEVFSNSVNPAKTQQKIINNDPITEDEAELFINKVNEIADYEEATEERYYTQKEIEEICKYYKKKYSRKMWITLICSLTLFCIIMGGMYLYINGYLSEFLNIL